MLERRVRALGTCSFWSHQRTQLRTRTHLPNNDIITYTHAEPCPISCLGYIPCLRPDGLVVWFLVRVVLWTYHTRGGPGFNSRSGPMVECCFFFFFFCFLTNRRFTAQSMCLECYLPGNVRMTDNICRHTLRASSHWLSLPAAFPILIHGLIEDMFWNICLLRLLRDIAKCYLWLHSHSPYVTCISGARIESCPNDNIPCFKQIEICLTICLDNCWDYCLFGRPEIHTHSPIWILDHSGNKNLIEFNKDLLNYMLMEVTFDTNGSQVISTRYSSGTFLRLTCA